MILMLPLEVFLQVLQLTPLYRMSIATYSRVEVLSESLVLIAFIVSLLTHVFLEYMPNYVQAQNYQVIQQCASSVG